MNRKVGSFAGVKGRVRNVSHHGEYGATVFVVTQDESITLAFNHLDKVFVKSGQIVVPETCLGYYRTRQPWWFR